MTIDETRWFEKWAGKKTSIEIRKPWDGTKRVRASRQARPAEESHLVGSVLHA
jgi:hypothetical protein